MLRTALLISTCLVSSAALAKGKPKAPPAPAVSAAPSDETSAELVDLLITTDNSWVGAVKDEKPYKLIFKVDDAVPQGKTGLYSRVSPKKVKGSEVPKGGWMPKAICVLLDEKGVWLLYGDSDSACPQGDALKGTLRSLRKPAIAAVPEPYKRETKSKGGDFGSTEELTVAERAVNGKNVRVWKYRFQQDFAFTVELAQGIGLVSYQEDLQDGGGTFTTSKVRKAGEKGD